MFITIYINASHLLLNFISLSKPKTKKMKKKIGYFLFAGIAMLAVSCGGGDTKTDDHAQDSTTAVDSTLFDKANDAANSQDSGHMHIEGDSSHHH